MHQLLCWSSVFICFEYKEYLAGSIIFFDEEKLRDCVVLDPYWLAEAQLDSEDAVQRHATELLAALETAEAAANIFNCPRVVQGRSASARQVPSGVHGVHAEGSPLRRLLERGELHVDLLRQHLWRSERWKFRPRPDLWLHCDLCVRFVDHIPVLINLMLRFDLLVSSSDQEIRR